MALSLWPQYTMAALILLGMGSSIAKFGKQKTDSYDFWDVLIGPALVVWLLYMGGFWSAPT